MSAYEDVRNDVITQYEAARSHLETVQQQEGLGGALSMPTVNVSGSQPAWLGPAWREALVAAALVGTVAGLALMAVLNSESSAALAFSGSFAIVALIVAYFTVAGHSSATFSIGSGANSSGDQGGSIKKDIDIITTNSKSRSGWSNPGQGPVPAERRSADSPTVRQPI